MHQLSLDLYYTEDEIYELSYTKEPKNPKIQVSRATRSSLKPSSISHHWGCHSFHTRRDTYLLSVGVTSSRQKHRLSKCIKISHIKGPCVREAHGGWMFFFFSCFSPTHFFASDHSTCCFLASSSSQTTGGGRMGFRGHPQA